MTLPASDGGDSFIVYNGENIHVDPEIMCDNSPYYRKLSVENDIVSVNSTHHTYSFQSFIDFVHNTKNIVIPTHINDVKELLTIWGCQPLLPLLQYSIDFYKSLSESHQKLVMELISSSFPPHIIRSFILVKREEFVLPNDRGRAYVNRAMGIGFDQTISQPYTIGIMLNQLDIKPGQKILEVGSGCGYVLSLLSTMVGENGKVYGIDIVPQLVSRSKDNVKKYSNVSVFAKSGTLGLPEYGPYDRILISAGCSHIPDPLIQQLKEGGFLTAPVGSSEGHSITTIERRGSQGVVVKEKHGFIFVPFQYTDQNK